MSKKKKWWQTSTSYEELKKKFPNSFKQHSENLPAKEYLTDDGYDYDDGYDDWGRNLGRKEEKVKFGEIHKEHKSYYDNYEKTGHWGGYSYYRVPQLSYKYVQQMANALAGQNNITLKIGNEWEVDLVNRCLTYNPASLIYGTKSELLATLLHEIGKLRYMDHYTTLQSKYLDIYKESAAEATFPFEDVRVDYQMLKAYESAVELYESAIPAVQRQIDLYLKYGKAFRETSVEMLKYAYKDVVDVRFSDPNEYAIRLMQTFGTNDLQKVQERINEMSRFYSINGSLYEYCADMLHVMYDLETPNSGFKNIEEKVEKCIPAIEPIKKQVKSQETMRIMDSEVFPHIEDLMKDLHQKKEQLQEMFPGMLEKMAEKLENIFSQIMHNKIGKSRSEYGQVPTLNANKDGRMKTMGGSGPTDERIPPEWKSGDYASLKESVEPEIRSLVQKLTFLRREEMTVKYQADQKRGKLNSKKLVKHAFGSRRLFKQKLPNVDTVQSFAFSVLMDISGSMEGPRLVHTTRAMVLFNEVFKKLNIPFELVVFGNNSEVIKGFDSPSDKIMEGRIGGLVSADGGGTNLSTGLEALTIKNRPEHNKIVVVLTDGGVGRPEQFDAEFFTPWREKNNIKSIAFGLEISGYEKENMLKMVEGTGRIVDSANQMPVEFAEVIKNIIKKKK